MAIVVKARSNGADVEQTVGFNNNQARCNGVSLHLAAQKVQVHARAQNVFQILHAGVLAVIVVPYGHDGLLALLIYHDGYRVVVPLLHNAALVGSVYVQALCCFLRSVWQQFRQVFRQSGTVNSAYQTRQCLRIIAQIVGRKGVAVVGMATHAAYGGSLIGGYTEHAHEAFDLRIQVAEAVMRAFQSLGAGDDERLVQRFVDHCRLNVCGRKHEAYARKQLGGIVAAVV